MNRRLVCLATATALLAISGPARAELCYMRSDMTTTATTGVPVHWTDAANGIEVEIYIPNDAGTLKGKFKSGLTVDQVKDAVKAAFNAYAGLECVGLAFTYTDAATIIRQNPGKIGIYFAADATEWIGTGTGAYIWDLKWNTVDDGEIEWAYIMLNAHNGPFEWTIGAEAVKLDIQRTVTRLLPAILGFLVDADASGTIQGAVVYEDDDRTIGDDQKTGAEFTYFAEGGSCTKPAEPALCEKAATGDGGPTTDGSTPTTDGSTPTTDGSTPTTDSGTPTTDGGTTTGDGGTTTGDGGTPPGDDDDGCCRVGHTRTASSLPYAVLVGLALMLLIRRRRR